MSRCRDCGAVWSGRAVCHCTACHETFTSEYPFALHQGAIEGCTPPGEVRTAKGYPRLIRNDKGQWTSSRDGGAHWAKTAFPTPSPLPIRQKGPREADTVDRHGSKSTPGAVS